MNHSRHFATAIDAASASKVYFATILTLRHEWRVRTRSRRSTLLGELPKETYGELEPTLAREERLRHPLDIGLLKFPLVIGEDDGDLLRRVRRRPGSGKR